jgi:hypothetical protein
MPDLRDGRRPRCAARRAAAVLAAAALPLLATAAGCGARNNADPMLIPGGGVGSGEIARFANVYVVDDATGDPVPGAYVFLEGDGTTFSGLTDQTGLARFEDRHLRGPQNVTAAASGFANTTWFGVNGANVTVPLRYDDGGAGNVETADVRGTIDAWDALPALPANHIWFAGVLYTWTERLGDAGNNIQQPTLPGGLPENACVKGLPIDPPCAWHMIARTGPQAHYYLLFDLDTMGNLDPSDDVAVLMGWGLLPGLDLTNGAAVTNEILPAPTMDVVAADLTVAGAPPGLDQLSVLPFVDLGTDEGWLYAFQSIDAAAPVAALPALSGPLSGATYRVLAAAAQSMPSGGRPSSTINVGGITDAAAGIVLPDFLDPPTGISAMGNQFGFAGDPDANVLAAEFRDTNDLLVWDVAFFDTTYASDFALPELPPEAEGMALPFGDIQLGALALDIPGFDPANFSRDDIDASKVERVSSNNPTLTR